MSEVICAACGLPIEGEDCDDRHWGHEPGCPRSDEMDCDCDIEYHAECCPECNEEPTDE